MKHEIITVSLLSMLIGCSTITPKGEVVNVISAENIQSEYIPRAALIEKYTPLYDQ